MSVDLVEADGRFLEAFWSVRGSNLLAEETSMEVIG